MHVFVSIFQSSMSIPDLLPMRINLQILPILLRAELHRVPQWYPGPPAHATPGNKTVLQAVEFFYSPKFDFKSEVAEDLQVELLWAKGQDLQQADKQGNSNRLSHEEEQLSEAVNKLEDVHPQVGEASDENS
mmetsp:Transcript_17591/g.45035  ORF Transcript_17591/g.45035 Transcript_17591/m.45035 type:complete len:132 (+) Transcript_17591:269-664(+)